jgi:hypothetical protein
MMSLQFPKEHNAISVKCWMLQPAAAQLPLKLYLSLGIFEPLQFSACLIEMKWEGRSLLPKILSKDHI